MAAEIECKIMGMSMEEFSKLIEDMRWGSLEGSSSDYILFFDEYSCAGFDKGYWNKPWTIQDSYYKLGVYNIRYRQEGIENYCFADLTMKGRELNDSGKISRREELILPLDTDESKYSQENVIAFVEALGAELFAKVQKSRCTYNSNLVFRIHHDELTGVENVSWIEIEADDETLLSNFLGRLGIPKDQVIKDSTLDIIANLE